MLTIGHRNPDKWLMKYIACIVRISPYQEILGHDVAEVLLKLALNIKQSIIVNKYCPIYHNWSIQSFPKICSRHEIAEILLKLALKTNQSINQIFPHNMFM